MQIDRIHKAYEQQYANPDTESDNDSVWECEDITEQEQDTYMGGVQFRIWLGEGRETLTAVVESEVFELPS